MEYRVTGKQVGVNGCTYTAKGSTAGEAFTQMLTHLRDEHDLELPDPEDVLENRSDESTWNRAAQLIIQRLRERLHLHWSQIGRPEPPEPPLTTPPPAGSDETPG